MEQGDEVTKGSSTLSPLETRGESESKAALSTVVNGPASRSPTTHLVAQLARLDLYDGGQDRGVPRSRGEGTRGVESRVGRVEGQPGVASTGPLPSLSSLSTVQDPELQRDLAKARRRQAEQPARMVSTHKLAVQGTVRASDYRLVDPEFGDSAEQCTRKSNNSKSIERNKATTAAEVRALFSKQSDSDSSGGGGGKSPGGVFYRMSTMTGTLDDLIRGCMVSGELTQGAHRVRRPPARTARQAEASAPPAATRNRASSLGLKNVDLDAAGAATAL